MANGFLEGSVLALPKNFQRLQLVPRPEPRKLHFAKILAA
jgi:hypothetical protein